MAVEINDTYGKYVGNNVNPKIIKRGKNSGIRRDTEMGDRAGESVVEVLLNQKDTLEISEQGRTALKANLKADEALEEKQGEVGFQSMKIKIDDDGEVTTESTSKSVAVNEQKRRRQIAAAATRGDMQAIIALLEQDLKEVEAGLEENACDEREVEKVKALLSEAKQKMSSLPDREPTPEEQAIMMMNTLM